MGQLQKNKLERIEANIKSTGNNIKTVCLQAYRAYVEDWDQDHVEYCFKYKLDPDEEKYYETIGDTMHWTQEVTTAEIIHLLK